MDILQLFLSRAAYHECVIALYEKRQIHTEIQSFRLCRDHKISPIQSKVYKGYGKFDLWSLPPTSDDRIHRELALLFPQRAVSALRGG
jgi:hypothetical protein